MTSALSAEFETRFLAHEGGQLAYDDTGGAGPLVLCIPGMGDLRSQYRHIRPVLVKQGYRVVTMDVRGFGKTSAQWSDYSAHAVGHDALALIDHLGMPRAAILGNSFAAGAALWAAHDQPTRVSGVVLLGPIVRDSKVSRLMKLTLDIGFAGPWRVWFWTTYWESLFPTAKPADHAAVKAALKLNLREQGRMAALQSMINLSKADIAMILPQTQVPSLLVMGTKDPDFSDAAAEAAWLSKVLNAKSLIVEGAGHYPHTEMPSLIAAELVSFLGGLQHLTETFRPQLSVASRSGGAATCTVGG